MPLAVHPVTVVDCPDPERLARFYAALLDWDVSHPEGDLWAARGADGGLLCFQQVEDYAAPDWPGQAHPQQMHLDLDVPDLDAAEAAVLRLGATKHPHQPGTSFRVFLDPAGHPFCLCLS